MLLGGQQTQQPTINGGDKGDGWPVQDQQGSGRRRSALGDSGRQQKCQQLHDGGS
jgi:hypothetical protein